MALTLGNWYQRIKGGWKTVNADGIGAFASDADWSPEAVSAAQALRLSAYFACVRLLSETMSSLTFGLIDKNNKAVMDHDIMDLMGTPSADQTQSRFKMSMTANKDVYGNAMAHIKRYSSTGKAYALDFYSTDLWQVTLDRAGRPSFALNGENVPGEDVLHWSGFSLNGFWGLPTILAGGEVLSMQIESNRSAARTFSSGLRAGGFFTGNDAKRAYNDEQIDKFNKELAKFSQPQNTAKWLLLPPGLSPVANQQFRIDPVTAELLQSRYFGIEEICRYMGVPPPLIGHTDKASSWASSLDGLNQFLVTYTLLPRAIGFEDEIARKLLGRNERSRLRPSFNMDSLLRGDIEKRFKSYDIGINRGIYSPDDARAKESMPPRKGGDTYVTPKQTQGTGS